MSAATPVIAHGPFRLGCLRRLPPEDLDRLVRAFDAAGGQAGRPVLAGRAAMVHLRLDAAGPVVVKPYRRGGLLGRVIRHTYLHGRQHRSQMEYDWLLRATDMGLTVPVPVAFAFRGHWFYRCWLVTRAVPGARTLAQMSLQGPDAAARLLPELARQMELLVRHAVWHPDLHPGNVLVDGQQRLFLIDFDKVTRVSASPRRLRLRYRRRWQRAVRKHQLPAELATGLEAAWTALEA
jgi:3-deoxy-D-manno-octulosonic acid kinase